MMTKEQRARFDVLVAEEVNSSMDLIRARNRATEARSALVSYVDALCVPAGTIPADIPEFLRKPPVQEVAPPHPPGCACDACGNARMHARLQGV